MKLNSVSASSDPTPERTPFSPSNWKIPALIPVIDLHSASGSNEGIRSPFVKIAYARSEGMISSSMTWRSPPAVGADMVNAIWDRIRTAVIIIGVYDLAD